MQSLVLKKERWKDILDHLSTAAANEHIKIEVVREAGTQSVNGNMEFGKLRFDTKCALLSIHAGGTVYFIRDPQEIAITYSANDVTGIEIMDRNDTRWLVTFLPAVHLPLLLPSISRTKPFERAE